MATPDASDVVHTATFTLGSTIPRHSIRLAELAKESRRLQHDFLRGSIQFSLTMAGLADSGPVNDSFRVSCRRAAQKGYGRICSMISKPSFAQLDLTELLPSLRRLESKLAEIGDDGGSIQPPVLPQPESSPAPNEKLKTLTPREAEVLRHVAEGHSTKEIAHLLGMSFKTAACHRYRVMDKLGIHDAVSLTRFAVRAGLVKL